MSNYDTGNPVPSHDPRDMDDNAKNLDLLLNGASDSYPDRTGVERKSYAKMEADSGAFSSPNVVALSGLPGAADKGFYFTAPETLATFDFKPVGRTFVGATTVSAQRTALGLKSASLADVLGIVSQTGGVPDGAIIEAGAGYIRWADGTQVCLRSGTTASIPLTTAAGALFSSADFATAAAFAKPFVAGSVPTVTYSYHQSSWYGFMATTSTPTATLWPSAKGVSTTSTSAVITWGMVAWGRWF